MKFELSEVEEKKYREWYKKHRHTCSIRKNNKSISGPFGAIGGGMSFTFMPTGLGACVKIECACGEGIDVTDYESW